MRARRSEPAQRSSPSNVRSRRQPRVSSTSRACSATSSSGSSGWSTSTTTRSAAAISSTRAGHDGDRQLRDARRRDVGLARPDVGAEREQPLDDRQRRRLPPVRRPGLVAEPEDEDPAVAHRQPVAVEQHHDPRHDVVGHVLVDVVRQLDEPERLAEPALHPPRQVRRVDRQAVSADARPGREPHVPERLRRRGVDRAPDVDAEVARRTSPAR